MRLFGAPVIFRPSAFICFDFTNRSGVGLHYVHEAIVINEATKAFKVAEKLLFLLIVSRQVDVTDQN
jgi:hypothetical protein